MSSSDAACEGPLGHSASECLQPTSLPTTHAPGSMSHPEKDTPDEEDEKQKNNRDTCFMGRLCWRADTVHTSTEFWEPITHGHIWEASVQPTQKYNDENNLHQLKSFTFAVRFWISVKSSFAPKTKEKKSFITKEVGSVQLILNRTNVSCPVLT